MSLTHRRYPPNLHKRLPRPRRHPLWKPVKRPVTYIDDTWSSARKVDVPCGLQSPAFSYHSSIAGVARRSAMSESSHKMGTLTLCSIYAAQIFKAPTIWQTFQLGLPIYALLDGRKSSQLGQSIMLAIHLQVRVCRSVSSTCRRNVLHRSDEHCILGPTVNLSSPVISKVEQSSSCRTGR